MGPPRKRGSSKTSKEVPTTQKKHKTNNSSATPNPTAPSGEWIEQSLYTVPCKTKSNLTEEYGVKEEPEEDQSYPNGINGETSGVAYLPSVRDLGVQCTGLDHHKIKDEQEEGDSHITNQRPVGYSPNPSITVKPHEPLQGQKWVLKNNEENQNDTTETEGTKVRSHTCFCGKSYTCSSHLNRHRKIHLSEVQLSGGHYNSRLSEEKATKQCFICQCGKQYTSNSNLKRHQNNCNKQALVETTDSVVPYQNVEDQEFKLKPYVCACGKSYTSSSHLYRHQRSHLESKSQTERRYICECGKAYSCSSHLYRHQRTHTEEKVLLGGHSLVEDPETLEKRIKPYVCFCGKSYTCSSHLYRHQKSHQVEISPFIENQEVEDNETEKRYKCECGRSYTSSSHLYRHQRTHKDQDFTMDGNEDSEVDIDDCRQKPYKCECGKSFILSFSLLLHKKIHCQWKGTTDCGPPGH